MKGTLEERLSELQQLYPAWEKRTIYSFFETTAQRFPQHDFVVQDNRPCYSYSQALIQTRSMAKALLAAGIRAGDHVALMMTNCAEQIFISLALSMLGAVKIPVNIALGRYELSYILDQSDSQYFISAYPVTLMPEKMPNKLKTVILAGGHPYQGAALTIHSLQALLAEGVQIEDVVLDHLTAGDDHAEDISDMICTSGSTGAPKGVPLTHDMLMRSAFSSCLNRGFEVGRRIYVPLPLFHCYGYIEGLLAAILVGGAILLRFHKFVAHEVVDFMRAYRANDILSVPSLMITLIRHLEEHPAQIKDLHAVYCSAALCPAWVWPGIRRHLQVDDLITGYGMTEVCGASMQTEPTDGDACLCTRVGKLLPGGCSGFAEYGGYQLQYRVVDLLTGQDCPEGVPGELQCRGSTVTKGYYNNSAVNQKVFLPDGWFCTGDVGMFDSNGYLILSGRTNDMYKINGENVSPKFLEDIIGHCDAISMVEIVGIPSTKYGAVGVAFVQLKTECPQNREIVEQYCRENLAQFQIPRHYIYLNSKDWPLTATGKVQKYRLRQMAIDHLSGGSA